MVGKGTRLNIFASIQNLLDEKYIERGVDGASHDAQTFRGYWGAPRLASIGMRVAF